MCICYSMHACTISAVIALLVLVLAPYTAQNLH
jgi:hypothetical protein